MYVCLLIYLYSSTKIQNYILYIFHLLFTWYYLNQENVAPKGRSAVYLTITTVERISKSELFVKVC